MTGKKDEPKVFKLWKCPVCGDVFNYWVTDEEMKQGSIACPTCGGDVVVNRVKKT
jgi:DNA-directed RNA polymerase subunit RPC12/RpoP